MSSLETNDPPTLLVVDDTPENLTVLGDLLQPSYRLRAANDGPRALRIANSDPRPDLILLDVSMPGMDGYEVLQKLRENPRTADIPVIFITAMNAPEDEEHGLELGAVDYITKPIRPTVVMARVRTHLELKAARDRLMLQNADLEAEIRRRMRDNQIVQDVSMRALASLAETRDNETGNHIRRTQGYVEILARNLLGQPGFEALDHSDVIDLIVKAAPLHDIGKVGIPDAILLKPGKLNAEEWVVMKTHSRIGAEAIASSMRGEDNHAPLAFLHVAMDIALYHHEKWDGSGYPEGLRGADIPVAARLMAVADVFDALISRRVYKPPMPLDDAVALIVAGRGAHFDPAIVDAFLSQIDQFQAVADRYADNEDPLDAGID